MTVKGLFSVKFQIDSLQFTKTDIFHRRTAATNIEAL